jgi:prophage antirepressor-like protein
MSNEVSVFNFENHDVRIVDQNGEPWWVLKDVCDVLGLSDVSRVTERIDAEDLTRIKLVSGMQTRDMYVVNESGLYSVILRSDKPEAKKFRRWVTHEVLPAIRKTGKYSVNDTSSPPLRTMRLMIAGKDFEIPVDREYSVSVSKTGCMTLRVKSPLTNPREKNAPAKESSKQENNHTPLDLTMFFQEECVAHCHYSINSEDLYNQYLVWVKNNPIVDAVYDRVYFFRELNKHYCKTSVIRKQTDKRQFGIYNGLTLRKIAFPQQK